METIDLLLTGCHAATMAAGRPPYGAVEDAAIAVRGGRIVWLGPTAETSAFAVRETLDLEGRWVTPGLIDCHTHLVFGGARISDYEKRLGGATYA